MATGFPLFSSLLPELRLRIWHLAFTASWSCTHLEVHQPKTVGTHLHKAIGQVCFEVRQALAKSHTYIEGLGWFNLPQYLLFVQDHIHGHCIIQQLRNHFPRSSHLRHIVISQRYWGWLRDILGRLAHSDSSLGI
jgi:hypothetical protein